MKGKSVLLLAALIAATGTAGTGCAGMAQANNTEPVSLEQRVADDVQIRKALEFIDIRDYGDARKALLDIAETEDNTGDAYVANIILGYIASRVGDISGRDEAFTKATDIYVNVNAPFYFELGDDLEREIAESLETYGGNLPRGTVKRSDVAEQVWVWHTRAGNRQWIEEKRVEAEINIGYPGIEIAQAMRVHYLAGETEKAENLAEEARRMLQKQIDAGVDMGLAEFWMSQTYNPEFIGQGAPFADPKLAEDWFRLARGDGYRE
ncbi:MAG: hypothetical protein ABIE94_04605 [archaeon]